MLNALVTLVALIIAMPAGAAELNVTLPGRDGMVLELPAGWVAQVRRPRPDLPPTIAVASADPKAFQVLLTPIWPIGNGKAPTADDLRRLVEGAAEQARAHTVESNVPIQDLAAKGKTGYFFSATDRQPEPEGFKYMTQGAIGLNELRITFTILINGEPKEVRSKALEMLRSIRRVAGKNAT
jgi:hypothetical protein